MRCASIVIGSVVLGAVACGGNQAGMDRGDAGVDGGDGGPVVAVCPDTSKLHSEGSASEPVSFTLASQSVVGQVRPEDGPSYYRVTELQVGARYKVQFTGSVWGEFDLFQSFSGMALCDKQTLFEDQLTCYVVPQQPTADIRISPVRGTSPACFGLAVAFDSPPEAFEGAPDGPLDLAFGTPDLPHRGIVDHYRSFYRITQLTPGKRYTVWMTGLEDDVDLFAGSLVLQEDRVSQTCVRGHSSGINLDDEWCTFVATRDYVDVEATDYYGGTISSKFVLSAFEDVDSEGSPAAPVVLAYVGGVTYPGHVGPQINVSDPPAKSYYQITGLTPGANYLIALTDSGGGTPWLYSDAAFSTTISCVGAHSCELVAPGSSIYLVVPSWVDRSRQFTLHVSAATVNQGSFTQPLALNYSAFPYTGQSKNRSEYLVSGLPPGPLRVTLSPLDAPLGVGAYSPAGGLIYGGDFRFPRGTVAASSAGELRVLVDDAGRFALDLRPASGLQSQYARVSGSRVIPDGDANGLSDTLTVSGSSITAISRMTVEVYVRHGQPQELAFVLVSPAGTEVQLVKKGTTDPSGAPERYEGVIYDDFALAREAGFLGEGSFTRRPKRPLHLVTGEAANGTWTLRVTDAVVANLGDDAGELIGWGLSFY